jgi:hypothetical protein
MTFTPDTELMRIFDFTAYDLDANRRGSLSERQIEGLKELLAIEVRVYAIIGIIVLIMVWFFFREMMQPIEKYGAVQGIANATVILVVGSVGVYLIILPLAVIQKRKAISARRVRHVDGKVEYKTVTTKTTHYFIRVSHKTFDIDFDTFLELQKHILPDTVYRFYFAPWRRNVLAAEMIDNPAASYNTN